MPPLLIVAVGVELRFFSDAVAEPAQRSAPILSLAMLCIGEVFALSALPVDVEDGAVFDPWHQYLAFLSSVNACLIALSHLVWVMVVRKHGKAGQPAVSQTPTWTSSPAPATTATPPKSQGAQVAVGLLAVLVGGWIGLRATRSRRGRR